MSSLSRNRLAKALTERVADIDWDSVIKYSCILAVSHYRQGEPVVEIGGKPETMEQSFQLWPLLEKGEPMTIFGPGGTGKSYLADYMAVLVQLNYAGIYGWLPESANVLYLDWESSKNIHERRIWAIKQGLGIDSEDKIFYRFCSQPFADDIADIQRLVIENNAGFVIVDSQVAASGDDPDKAESASRYYNALRSLRCTTLTIDHVPKNTEGKAMPFGSVFKWNRARSLFEVKQVQEPGENAAELGLYHRKCNEGKLLQPIGLKLQFHYGPGENLESVVFSETDIRGVPELAKALPLKDRIRGILQSGPMTIGDIAEEMQANEGSIKTILNRGKNLFARNGNMWGLLYDEAVTP